MLGGSAPAGDGGGLAQRLTGYSSVRDAPSRAPVSGRFDRAGVPRRPQYAEQQPGVQRTTGRNQLPHPAAKARARGYRTKNKMITIAYLIAGKLPLPTVTNARPA